MCFKMLTFPPHFNWILISIQNQLKLNELKNIVNNTYNSFTLTISCENKDSNNPLQLLMVQPSPLQRTQHPLAKCASLEIRAQPGSGFFGAQIVGVLGVMALLSCVCGFGRSPITAAKPLALAGPPAAFAAVTDGNGLLMVLPPAVLGPSRCWVCVLQHALVVGWQGLFTLQGLPGLSKSLFCRNEGVGGSQTVCFGLWAVMAALCHGDGSCWGGALVWLLSGPGMGILEVRVSLHWCLSPSLAGSGLQGSVCRCLACRGGG